jgi:hypothetical protein
MEGVNSFEKGLHRTNSPVEQPEGSYVDALNWIRNDSGRLVNEELEVALGTAFPNHILLGYTPVNNLFICFFQVNGTDSEIGTFEKGVYKSIFNDATTVINNVPVNYKLNFKNQIDCVARINNYSETVVYFVEEDNPIRRFNLDLINDYKTLDDWSLQLILDLPYADISIVNNGGNLLTGVYSVVFRYATAQNNKTSFGIPSRFISIIDDNGVDDNSDGSDPQKPTSKYLNFTVKRVDTNYPYIEPVIITYIGLTNQLIVKSLGLYPNVQDSIINFSSDSQYQDTVDISEITNNPLFYESAKCIEQKDNILILSNLTTKKYNRDFQNIANNIDVTWYEEIYTPPQLRIIAAADGNGDYRKTAPSSGAERYPIEDEFGEYIPTDLIDNTDQANNVHLYKDPFFKKSFTRGEVYSFSITPIYKDGSIGFAYYIPAKANGGQVVQNNYKRTYPWKSEAPLPDYLGTTGNIFHHQMPDYDTLPLIPNNSPNGSVSILRVKFLNINFSTQTDTIQGYIIGYQPRTNDTNTRIIDSGIIKPYMANGDIYVATPLNGVVSFRYESNATMTYVPSRPYSMFYSPDQNIGKRIESGKSIQKTGYAQNYINNFAGSWRELVIMLSNNLYDAQRTGYLAFYFDGNKYVQSIDPAVKIVESIYRENLSTETENKINGNFTCEGGTSYTHLQTNSTVWNNWDDLSNNSNSDGRIANYFIKADDTFTNLVINDISYGSYQALVGVPTKNLLTLARIINPLNQQYGRLENANYVISEVSYDLNNTEIDVEGDTYVFKYWFFNRDIIRNNYQGGTTFNESTNNVDFDFMAGVWLESQNNHSFRHYNTGEVPYYPKFKRFKGGSGNLGLLEYDWWKRTEGYNKQYSVINNTKNTFAQPTFLKEITEYANRSVFSEKSFESELADQYRIFPANNFHDIPKDRGPIIDTFVFNNNFFHHTEFGLWQSYFNPNTIQSTTQGDVVLGNAGVFKIPSKLIIDIKGGYMGTKDKSGTNTPFGRVFLDHHQGKVFLFAGEAPVEISDLGLFPFFREFVNTTDEYCMGYDWINKRLLVNNISQKTAISFYPKTQTWTSFHDFSPTAYLSLNRETYAWQNTQNSFYNLTNPTGTRKNSYITFVENTQPDAFKRFDRIEMNTMSGGNNQGIFDPGSIANAANYDFKNQSFSKIHCWTDRQNSTNLDFDYPTNFNTTFLSNYDPTKVTVNYYKGSFHAELPLDAVTDPYANIFDTINNTDITASFRAHMKAKFLYTKLSYNDTDPLVLNYVKTYFKPTVA